LIAREFARDSLADVGVEEVERQEVAREESGRPVEVMAIGSA
jgi:hypothetical protein